MGGGGWDGPPAPSPEHPSLGTTLPASALLLLQGLGPDPEPGLEDPRAHLGHTDDWTRIQELTVPPDLSHGRGPFPPLPTGWVHPRVLPTAR